MKKIVIMILLAAFVLSAIGCGSTASGLGKDARRIGRGVKTIFVRDGVEE